MYYPLGRTLVLQPDEAQSFVYGNTDHPMLPPGPNLFTLRDPWTLASATDKLRGKLNSLAVAAGLEAKKLAPSSRLQRFVLPELGLLGLSRHWDITDMLGHCILQGLNEDFQRFTFLQE